MRIHGYKSQQYAGAHDRDITFAPGMNVVLGDNEAGKSTMISGMMDTLLMTASLKKSLAAHKAFIDSRFPVDDANYIDGELRLSLQGQELVLRKEWDKLSLKDSRTSLRFDGGRLLTGPQAEQELRDLLGYGDAVCRNIVFGRQDNREEILDWFFAFINENSKEGSIAQAREQIAGAISAAGGVSEEGFLRALEAKLEELDPGGHWDHGRDRPMGGRELDNPWKKEVGLILSAYYAWRERERDYNDAVLLIDQVAEWRRQLEDKRREKRELASRREGLMAQKSLIATSDLLGSRLSQLKEKLRELDGAKRSWPELLREEKEVSSLCSQLRERDRRREKDRLDERVRQAKALSDGLAGLREKMAGKEDLADELAHCRALRDAIRAGGARLGAVKLHASISLADGRSAQVETAGDRALHVNGSYEGMVKGYARISIPDVAEIMIAPEDLDVDAVQGEIAACEREMEAILEKYGADGPDALARLAEEQAGYARQLQELDAKLKAVLADKPIQDLEEEAAGIESDPSISIREDLDQRAGDILRGKSEDTLEGRLAVVRSRLEGYERAYGSIQKLDEDMDGAQAQAEETGARLEELGQVQLTMDEFEAQVTSITRRLDGPDGNSGLTAEIERIAGDIAKNGERADSLDPDGLMAERDRAFAIFEQSKRRYGQYVRIREDFQRLRGQADDKYADFYQSFNRYLGTAAGDGLSVTGQDGVVSHGSALPGKSFLSQGTKQVILLAFRLALLEAYYRDGGGVIVLDDVLLDMDPERRRRAAEMLQGFAQENQVIFTTCDPAIADLLGGNRIEMG